MMKTIFTIFLLLFSTLSLADLPFKPTFAWSPPTAWESGDVLDPATDIAEYRLYCSPGVATQSIAVNAEPYQWTAPIDLFLPGSYSCYMTAVVTAARGGSESVPSGTVTFDISVNSPAPVVVFTVQ